MLKINLSKWTEFYRNLSKRERVIFYATASIVLIVALDMAVVAPIHNTLKYLDQKIADTEANIKKSVLLLDQKEQVEKEADYYAAYSSQAKSSEERTLILLKKIEEIANQSGVNLLFVKPAGAGSSQQEGVDKVNLECEGQIEKLIAFFHAVDSTKLLLKAEKFSLQPVTKGSSVIRCSATVAMTSVS